MNDAIHGTVLERGHIVKSTVSQSTVIKDKLPAIPSYIIHFDCNFLILRNRVAIQSSNI